MRAIKTWTLVLALSAALMPGPAHAAPDGTELQAALDLIVADNVAGTVAEVRHEDGLWRGASGASELVQGVFADPADKFRIGSVTKTFVAALVMKLVGDGKVALAEPVEKYLPGLLAKGGQITVRMLLDHTSGLGDYTETFDDTPAGFRKLATTTYTPEQLVELGAGLPPKSEPGGPWSYTNTGYAVLGMLVEKVTRRSLSEELQDKIFTPLHLDDTSMPTTQTGIEGPTCAATFRKSSA